MNNSLSGKHAALIILLILAATPYFIRLGASSLWDSNEAFYAETPREMVESGDYINPTFNYQPRFNKPPLCYWIVALFYKLFGVSETVERVTIALAAIVMIGTAYALGSAIFSFEAGLLAAVGLAVAPRFLMFSRRIMIDVYLAMFMSLALLFFVLADKHPRKRRLLLALMYASAGLGVMTKGPVAAALPGLAFIICLALFRGFKSIRQMMLPMGIVIVAAIVLPWYVAIYNEHGWSYIATFLLKDNLSRYTQPVWGPQRGPFFYIPVMIGDFFPWSFFLPAALWVALRKKINDTDERRNAALLVIWIIVIVVFFSLSKSKEDLYILPIYPAAAALAGGVLARFIDKASLSFPDSLVRWTCAALGVVLLVAGALVFYLSNESAPIYKLAGAAAIGCVAFAGGSTAALLAVFKKDFVAIASVALTVTIFNWIFLIETLPDFERFKPVRPVCELIAARAAPDSLVGYYRVASPSMVFYLRRPIFEYYKPGEIEQAFVSGKEVYCLMSAQDYEAMKETLPVATYVLASRPVFQVKLKSIFDKAEPPQVVIISNKGGADIAR